MMKRSQIYLSVSQWSILRALSHQAHKSVSQLIRDAIEKVYKKPDTDFETALRQGFGIWKDRKDLPPTDEYIRRLRKSTRLERLNGG